MMVRCWWPDAGMTDGNGKVLKYENGAFKLLAEGFNPPLTGITHYKGLTYVAHRGFVTTVTREGIKKNILQGLPSWGDHHNNKVEFGPDGKMYFGQGTATNSGVVGEDNQDWAKNYPLFHDAPGQDITLRGQNFTTPGFLHASGRNVTTGAYLPFGTPSKPGEVINAEVKASGSVMRANPDGSNLEMVAWGLRNPFRMRFDRSGRLFTTNHGMDVRGSRPVANSPDEFHLVKPGTWYGWPDYTGGFPVTDTEFKAQNLPQPEFLLSRHPMMPPKPFSAFQPHAAVMGFDYSRSADYPEIGDVFIAEFGSEAPETTGGLPDPYVGHRVSVVSMRGGQVFTFAANKSGMAASATDGGGFERPIDAVFGPDGHLYVVDFNYAPPGSSSEFIPGTGVIWRIRRT
jgi:glucose/arabinose dehydrogenase